MMAGSGVPTATSGGAPSRTWTAGVVRMAPPTPNAPAMIPETKPDRMPRMAWPATVLLGRRPERPGRAVQDVPFARKCGPRSGLPQGDPLHVFHLVVVEGDVPTHGLHEEEDHALPHPGSLPHVPVRDVAERLPDLGHQPRLLAHLAHRGLLGLLAGFDQTLG